jgi:hypothetical protein
VEGPALYSPVRGAQRAFLATTASSFARSSG